MVTMPQNSLINHAMSLTNKVRTQSELKTDCFECRLYRGLYVGTDELDAKAEKHTRLELQALGLTGN